MSILVTNNNLIENEKYIYIHDDMLREMSFDRMEKKMYLLFASCGNSLGEKKFCTQNGLRLKDNYQIIFGNVAGFCMSSCDFWGPDDRAAELSFKERDAFKIIPELIKRGKQFDDDELETTANQYMELEILFISGDILTIACQSMEFDKYEINF